MKIRNGYVSNSSSSSFVVLNLDKLTQKQIDQIMNYDKECYSYCLKHRNKYKIEETDYPGYDKNLCNGKVVEIINKEDSDGTFDFINDSCRFHMTINTDDNCIDGITSMTNFNMKAWLKTIGVKFRYSFDH